MKPYRYAMPTTLVIGKNCIVENGHLLREGGAKALLVTGRHSARKCGALRDVTLALDQAHIPYVHFDQTEENPSVENVVAGARFGIENGVDFVIGIGGGSPLDAAKAIAVLIRNPDKEGADLYKKEKLEALPLYAVPTTAGTGSEVTPYAILTLHKQKTKQRMNQLLFPRVSFLDATYLAALPWPVTVHTTIDALSHLIESYLCVGANPLSDMLNENGFSLFSQCKDVFQKGELDFETREKLLLMSAIGGMAIAQTGTSIPHGLGYALTYNHNIPHGLANCLVMIEYLKHCEQGKMERMLRSMGFEDLSLFSDYLKPLVDCRVQISEDNIVAYAKEFSGNEGKMKSHWQKLSYEDIYTIYKNSLQFYGLYEGGSCAGNSCRPDHGSGQPPLHCE